MQFTPEAKKNFRNQLLSWLPQGGHCAEIGVYKGNFSAEILERNKPTKLHLIDPWAWQPDPTYSQAVFGGTDSGRGAELSQLHEDVLQRFSEPVKSGTVIVHRAFSHAAASKFEDSYFDWVYIDGDHSYDGALQDLQLYHTKVKPDGFLVGDDYHIDAWWGDGIRRAVRDFIREHDYEIICVAFDQFVLRRLS